jgi:hypothetical protein
LREKYRNELKLIATTAHDFRTTLLQPEARRGREGPKAGDQRSIQFDLYQGRVVLKITGNYFVSYSAELLKPESARLTYESVMLPPRTAVHTGKGDAPRVAFEISHRTQKVLGVSSGHGKSGTGAFPEVPASG